MNDDRLRSLLKSADSAAPAPVYTADLARAVPHAYRRRMTVRIVAGTATAALAMAIVIARIPRQSIQPASGPIAVDPSPAAAVDLAALNREAQLHGQIAERLWAAERLRQGMARAQSSPDPLAAIGRTLDRASLVAFDRADQLAAERQFAAAAEEFQQTIRLFPQTHWAAVARQRLAELENRKDG